MQLKSVNSSVRKLLPIERSLARESPSYMKQKKPYSSKKIEASFRKLSDEIQELAIFAIQQAKTGEIKYANQLVDAVIETALFQPDYIIEWFEVFGKLKWSNKKGKLVYSDQGRWLISKAQSNHWADIPLGKISKGTIKTIPIPETTIEPLTASNFSDLINAYLKAHPAGSDKFGKFGVPADKNRWGKYKIKIKY
jgi:hypothetical protein